MRSTGFNGLAFGAIFGLLMSVFGGSGQQPARPDFSGKWTVQPAAAPAPSTQQRAPSTPGDLGSGWGSTITIAQTASELTVEYAFFTRGDMQPPIRHIFALDGRETKNTVMMGRGFQTERSKAAWDGASLVITTLHDYFDPATGKPAAFEVTRRLTLDAPDTLRVETTRAGSVTDTVFRKS